MPTDAWGNETGVSFSNPADLEARVAADADPANRFNPGTSWDVSMREYLYGRGSSSRPVDERGYMYGRSATGADEAANRALATGQGAQGAGENLLALGLQNSQDAMGRGAMYGNWGAQNNALGSARAYGMSLAALERQQGPSAAQAQLQQGTNQAMGSQIALARSGRGFGGGAGAAGLAQGNLAGLQANQANQAAMLRSQEEAARRQRQAANLVGAAGIQQGIGQQYGQQQGTDLNAYYQNQQQNDQAALGWAGYGSDAYTSGVGLNFAGQDLANNVRGQELNAGMQLDDRYLRAWAAANGQDVAGRQEDRADRQETAGYIGAGAAALAQLSDVRAKKNIERSDKPALDFARAGSMVTPKAPDTDALDAVAASPGYGYMYEDPSAPGAKPGQQYGPMAQELAATPAGSTAVVEQPDGQLGVDPARLQLLDHSAISAQQREIDALKEQIAMFAAQPGASYPLPSQGSF